MHQILLSAFSQERGYALSLVLLNGSPAPPGQKRGEFQIPRPDGTSATVQLLSGFLDHVPRVTVDGIPQTLAPPLNWAEKTLTLLPIVLVFSGGMIGGICGGIAVTANMAIFRSDWPPAARYAAASVMLLAALVLDLALIRVVWPYLHPALAFQDDTRQGSVLRDGVF